MENSWDVAIVGGGVVGAAAAVHLSRFDLKIGLLEKRNDVCFGVSKANSGIVHGGFHYDAATTVKGRLERRGNLLFDAWSRDLGFPFVRCGILVVAFAPEQLPTVEALYKQGVANGIPGIELCDAARIRELEPKLDPSACGGLHAPGGGVVEPYAMVFALIETARRNGLELKTNCEVVSARHNGEYWEIEAADGRTFTARYAINAAGLYADEVSRAFGAEEFRIRPRKGEEYLLDRESAARPRRVIFPVPSPHTKGVLVIPTAGGTTMIGPTSLLIDDKEDTATTAENRRRIFEQAGRMVSGITEKDLIASFSGSRPVMDGREDFYIERSAKAPHLIHAAGILSPGLTASPAIAEELAELLRQDGLTLTEKSSFELPEKTTPLREMPPEEAAARHADDPALTNIVCRCEMVSEAEIRRAIRRGHATLDGVKLATRAGMGRCQGGFCTLKIMKLIAEECGIPLEEVLKNDPGSRIAAGRLGEKAP